MSGYPHNNQSGYNYGAPPPAQPYSAAPYGGPTPPPNQYGSSPYGAAPSDPYGQPPHDHNKPPKDQHGQHSAPYGTPAPAAPYGQPGYPDNKPPKDHHGQHSASYGAPAPAAPYGQPGYPAQGNPFAALVPSVFPPGTDPNVVSSFQMADRDGSGLIDDLELQKALTGSQQSFSLRTVHLLMYLFTNTNTRKIGPKEFTAVFYSLQSWRGIFERFDRDRSGKIDASELREALMSLGFVVSPVVLDLLVSKFDKTGGRNKAIEYDNFIECCLTVKGLTEKFKEKDTGYMGSATFTYEAFMLTVLPFLIA